MRNEAPALAYDGRVVLLSWLDAGWTRPSKNTQNPPPNHQNPFLWQLNSAQQAFVKRCEHRRKAHEDYLKEFCKSRNQKRLKLPPELFSPTTWLPLGHADVLGVVLSDSLSAVQGLIAEYPRTVEEATLGFSLDVKELCELAGALKGSLVNVAKIVGKNDPQLPLLLFARLKMEGLLTLVAPVASQRALHAAIIRRFAKAHEEWTEGWKKSFGSPKKNLRFTLMDLQGEEEVGILFLCRDYSFPAALLAEIQGLTIQDLWDESAALKEAFKDEAKDGQLLDWLTQSATQQKELPQKRLKRIARNHALRWSRSSLAFSFDLLHQSISYLDKGAPQKLPQSLDDVKGWVSPANFINVPPGHMAEAELIVAEALDLPRHLLEHQNWPDDPGQKHRLVAIGPVDLVAVPSSYLQELRRGQDSEKITATDRWKSLHSTARLLPTRIIVLAFANLVRQVQISLQKKAYCGRNIAGWSTHVGVPVPASVDTQGLPVSAVQPEHDPLLFKALNIIRAVLFPEEAGEKLVSGGSADSRVFSFLRLRSKMRGYSSQVLIRAMEHLVANLGIILTHPLRFDVVLDYMDVLESLYRVLTEHLPKRLKAAFRSPKNGLVSSMELPRLSEAQEQSLAKLIDALSSSLELRLRHSFPEAPIRDWSLDSRTNLTQAIITADAVAKYAIGILRRSVLFEKDHHDVIGIAHKVTFERQMRIHACPLGVEERTRLGYFEADTGFFTNVATLSDYWHEVFHIVQDVLSEKRVSSDETLRRIMLETAALGRGTVGEIDEELHHHQTSEIFVNTMMLLFVFDGDEQLLLRQAVHQFACSPRAGSCSQDSATGEVSIQIKNWMNALLPPLVAVAFRKSIAQGGRDKWHLPDATGEMIPFSGKNGMWSITQKALRFCRHLLPSKVQAALCPLPQQTKRNLQHDLFRKLARRIYSSARINLANWMPLMFRIRTAHILANLETFGLSRIASKLRPTDLIAESMSKLKIKTAELGKFRNSMTEVDKALDTCVLRDGKKSWEAFSKVDLRIGSGRKRYYPDGSVIVARTLYRAMKHFTPSNTVPSDDETHFLWRNCRKKNIPVLADLKAKLGKWYSDEVMSPTDGEVIINDPEKRRQRVGQQAALLKTLWDSAGPIRKKRLIHLLKRVRAVKRSGSGAMRKPRP